MLDPPLDVRRAFRRCKLHHRVLVALAERGGRAYPEDLARGAHVNQIRLHNAMHGRLPGYRRAFCPLQLRLVRQRRDAFGVVYELAPRGRAILVMLGVDVAGASESPATGVHA